MFSKDLRVNVVVSCELPSEMGASSLNTCHDSSLLTVIFDDSGSKVVASANSALVVVAPVDSLFEGMVFVVLTSAVVSTGSSLTRILV